MSLPIFHTDNKDFQLMQTTWSQKLNPVIALPINNSLLLESVSLSNGANVINHKLGRKLKGWMITRIRNTAVSIYDTQDSNTSPALTLQLTSNANVNVDILVF